MIFNSYNKIIKNSKQVSWKNYSFVIKICESLDTEKKTIFNIKPIWIKFIFQFSKIIRITYVRSIELFSMYHTTMHWPRCTHLVEGAYYLQRQQDTTIFSSLNSPLLVDRRIRTTYTTIYIWTIWFKSLNLNRWIDKINLDTVFTDNTIIFIFHWKI